ncbi:MAG: hypothetical protein ACE5FQ_13160 [Thiogranum sp.]
MKRLITLLGVTFSATALAHGPEKTPALDWRAPVSAFDPSAPAQNETVRLDLKVEGDTLKLFVTDSYGNPVDVDIAEARALVSSAGKTTWFSLRPAGMNMLSGSGEFEHDPAMRVDITLRLPGRRPLNRDFRPFQ